MPVWLMCLLILLGTPVLVGVVYVVRPLVGLFLLWLAGKV